MNLWACIEPLNHAFLRRYAIHVALVNIEAADGWSQYETYLSTEEYQQAQAFIYPADRRRFVIVHAALRHLLAKELGCRMEALVLARSPTGKPYIAQPAVALHFSLAHTERFALIAWSWETPLGIDLETLDYGLDVCGLAPTICNSSELQWLVEGPISHCPQRFLRLWTAKEALLKLYGSGFLADPRQYGVLPALQDTTVVVKATAIKRPCLIEQTYLRALPLLSPLIATLAFQH